MLPYWQAVEQYAIIGAVIIIVLGYFFALLMVRIMRGALHQITRRTKSTLDDRLSMLIGRPVFITIFFYALGLAMRSLDIRPWLTGAVLKILASLVILVWLNALMPASKVVLDALGSLKERFNIIEERTIPLFNILSSIILIGLAALGVAAAMGLQNKPVDDK